METAKDAPLEIFGWPLFPEFLLQDLMEDLECAGSVNENTARVGDYRQAQRGSIAVAIIVYLHPKVRRKSG